jgi:tetratricopeptide (TPR) repeat protein/tRNA A-37 threonylcarbamoyl transferase component Bud32
MRECPSDEELQSFLAAAVPEAQAAIQRAHISGCRLCQQALDRLTDSETMNVWKSAASVVRSEIDDELELNRLRRALRAMSTQPTLGQDRSGTAVESSAPHCDWRAVLGPPKRAGDLGTLGDYLIEAELGQGRMGIVFRAFDPALRRRVALKLLRPDLAHPQARRRLVHEARAAAQFRHDHVVAVYAVVEPSEGLPYLVMEYLDGPTLSQLIKPGIGLEPRRAASIAAEVADALAAAHAAGLVHRDIKPDNIMIDPTTGRAKLMDFGLARDEASLERLTRDNALAGTPTHMSPEQARGLELDGRSDVYSLGVTLYECLTGEVPFRGAPHMVLQQVCDDEPRPPRRLNDRAPRDLETICLKAMAKEPPKRYATARDLADDLRRWLHGESIRARPPGPVGRLGRWCRRNTRLAVLIATVFALLVSLAAVSSVAALRIAREQRKTLREHEAARDHYKLALDTLKSLVLDVNQKLGARPGTLELKRDILETARTGLEKIAKSTESAGTIDRGAVIAYEQLGGLLFALGRTAEAFRAFETSRDLAAPLVKADPASIEVARDLALAHDQLGELNRYNNDIPAAEASFRRAIAVREALIKRHGQYPEVLRDLCVSANKIGLIRLRKGEFAAASGEFLRALDYLNQYAPTYLPRVKVLLDYEYTYRQLALSSLMSDWAAGAEYSRKALESAQAVVAIEPDNLVFRTKLAIDYDQLGTSLAIKGDLGPAQVNYQKAREVREAILAAEPGSAESQRNVAVSYRFLGAVATACGDADAARDLGQKALTISEKLADADPGSAQKQGDILDTLYFLSDNAERAERFGEALEWAERTLKRVERLAREKQLGHDMLERYRLIATGQRALYQAAARGLGLGSPGGPATDLPPVLSDWWKLLRALSLVRRGRHADAAVEICDVFRHDPQNALKSLRVSRVYARCAQAITPEQAGGALTPAERRLQQSYVASARAAVRQALKLAPEMAPETIAEPDLDFLRKSGDLQSVAREAGKEGTGKAETGAPKSWP